MRKKDKPAAITPSMAALKKRNKQARKGISPKVKKNTATKPGITTNISKLTRAIIKGRFRSRFLALCHNRSLTSAP